MIENLYFIFVSVIISKSFFGTIKVRLQHFIKFKLNELKRTNTIFFQVSINPNGSNPVSVCSGKELKCVITENHSKLTVSPNTFYFISVTVSNGLFQREFVTNTTTFKAGMQKKNLLGSISNFFFFFRKLRFTNFLNLEIISI